jgi:hypothetical protein
MATFAGKQPNAPDPTIRHESQGITSGQQPTYSGAQPNVTPPVVQLWLLPLWKIERRYYAD